MRWRECDHNPIALLQQMPIAQLEARASQLALHGRINYAYRRLQEYLQSKHTWGGRHAGVLGARPVAYFSAEFGLHESLPIYSGGLGILAGDHIKSASISASRWSASGCITTRATSGSGWTSTAGSTRTTSTSTARAADGAGATRGRQPLTVEIETRTGRILAKVWRNAVGRNTLLLLDSNVDGNSPEDRQLTSRLYGGDERVRIRQELVLGVGGARRWRARHLARRAAPQRRAQRLRRAGADPRADGRRGHRRRRGAAPRRRALVFTTHTPVPAGHDRFPAALVEEHLGPLRDALGLSHDDMMALGRVDPHDTTSRSA